MTHQHQIAQAAIQDDDLTCFVAGSFAKTITKPLWYASNVAFIGVPLVWDEATGGRVQNWYNS